MSWIFLVCLVLYLFGPVASGSTGFQCGLTKCQDGHICILKMDSSKLNIHCSLHTNHPQTIPCLQSSPTNIQDQHIDCYCTSKLCIEQTLQLLRESHKEPNPKHDDVVHMARTLSPSTTPAVTTTTIATFSCTDIEDQKFSCAVYDAMYNICKATATTLRYIVSKRCRKFCGLCTVNEQTTTTTASVKKVCVDHDSRCPRFKDQICQPTVPDEYVIATCALTCDKCPEYLGISRPTTVKSKQIPTSTPRITTPCLHHKPITPPFHTLTRKPLVVKHCNKLDLLNAYGDAVRVTHPDARRCPLNGFAKSDAVVMKYCSAHQVSSWIPDIQVSGNCQYLPTYIPIAQFHRGAVTDKTGIFVSCQQGNDFVMLSQSCDKGLHLVNVTWPENESFNVVTWATSPISVNVSSTTHTTKPTTTSATTHTMLPTTTSATTHTMLPTTPSATTHTMLPMTTSATTQKNSTSTVSINTKNQVMTTTMSTGGCTDLAGVNCTVLQNSLNVCSMPIADQYCPRTCGLCQHSTLHVNPVQIFGRK